MRPLPAFHHARGVDASLDTRPDPLQWLLGGGRGKCCMEWALQAVPAGEADAKTGRVYFEITTGRESMSTPKFSKEFNVEHAKAGAPYCCRNGEEAAILKWDGRRENEPLIGARSDCDSPTTWGIDGAYLPGRSVCNEDLVMLPLGMIDGKPVFVGDKYLGYADTECVAGPGMSSDWSGCKWPAPAKVYPLTQMDSGELHAAYGPKDEPSWHSGAARSLANAALRHAIDAGQIISMDDHIAALHALSQNLRGVEIARHSMRDLEIALEVRDACLRAVSVASMAQQDIDLAAIIAQVKP